MWCCKPGACLCSHCPVLPSPSLRLQPPPVQLLRLASPIENGRFEVVFSGVVVGACYTLAEAARCAAQPSQ